MKISREQLAARAQDRRTAERRVEAGNRGSELIGLIAATLVVALGLVLVYGGRTRDSAEVEKNALDLNGIKSAAQLVPLLGMIPDAPDQEFVANRIYEVVRHEERFANTGALARLRVKEADLTRGLVSFPLRMAEAKKNAKSSREPSITLLTATQFSQLKPSVRVRATGQIFRQYLLWSILFFVGFFAVHFFWQFRGFAGDTLILPIIELLSGTGLILMFSLRDPLRDTLMFADFAQGVLWGCLALIVFSIPDYERQFGRLSWVPLLAALLLAVALGIFGTGPGASDAKVNLFFFQPVEVIRILLVLFLAGYFAQNWDALRQLRQEHGRLAKWSSRFNIPRLDYLLPVLLGVAASLGLFFLLSDLGPALVIGCLFLTMYSIARKRALLAAAGLAVIVGGFFVGYITGHPRTVTDRVHMWRSPWDNHVRGGGQLADSLWSLSTGGASGTGLGLGDSEIMPAAHTDLIVSAFGEQAGLVGILALYLLYAALIFRGVRIALDAPGTYSFFLVIGLALILAYQILLITGGLLGLIPLSGVVSPFLSFGRTSMAANFALFAIILSVSNRARKGDTVKTNFGGPTRSLMLVLGCLLLGVLVRFTLVQTMMKDEILVRPALVVQADGARRYQYNPRILEIAREIPKGAILDRNGIPLATNDWAEIEKHRDDYQKLGVTLEQTASKQDRRHYPVGAPLFYLLGDPRNRLKAGAKNTAFQERASRVRLQGYDDVVEVEDVRDPETGFRTTRVKRDYHSVIPLLRHRYEPNNKAVREILDRPRDVHMSIDLRLQMRASDILRAQLAKLKKEKGAIVIMDPATGDLLASVSYPWPTQDQFSSLKTNPQTPLPSEDLLDRARFGLYPPGSSFKIVTAIAALSKDPALAQKHYTCDRLPDGRIGTVVRKRPIHDDVKDTVPHGNVDMQRGVVVSCNAYFAQLGDYDVGSQALYDTATKLGISVARPNTALRLRQLLPQASYGQGEVVVSPFQMARVVSTIANDGNAPEGRWVIDETNPRVRQPEVVLAAALAGQIGGYMRGVVTSGTGTAANASPIPIAGKTGTAELGGDLVSHAWFIGFAPYAGAGSSTKQIAFAILVENGQYGGTASAPMAVQIVAAARELGLL